jgi:hypothetical protein
MLPAAHTSVRILNLSDYADDSEIIHLVPVPHIKNPVVFIEPKSDNVINKIYELEDIALWSQNRNQIEDPSNRNIISDPNKIDSVAWRDEPGKVDHQTTNVLLNQLREKYLHHHTVPNQASSRRATPPPLVHGSVGAPTNMHGRHSSPPTGPVRYFPSIVRSHNAARIGHRAPSSAHLLPHSDRPWPSFRARHGAPMLGLFMHHTHGHIAAV